MGRHESSVQRGRWAPRLAPFRQRLNGALDSLARVQLCVLGTPRPGFQVYGCIGAAAGAGAALVLSARLALSLWVAFALIASACCAFFALAMFLKVLTGKERLVYYHHETAIFFVALAVPRLLGQPVLPYLDIAFVGLGVFLLFGRLGCLTAGCCHGRPSDWGVAYRVEHAREGFPDRLVGVRFFPIQMVESVFVLVIVLAGCSAIVRGLPAGTAFAAWVALYGAGRFTIEFWRGDSGRGQLLGLTFPQWVSLGRICLLCAAEAWGFVPWSSSHIVMAAGGLAATAAVSAWSLRRSPSLADPDHLFELAGALRDLRGAALCPHHRDVIASTSRGLRISGDTVSGQRGLLSFYTFSYRNCVMSQKAARQVAGAISKLRPARVQALLEPSPGVFHLIYEEIHDVP